MEQRKEIKLKDIIYVQNLPTLNILTRQEIEIAMNRLQPLIEHKNRLYRNRPDSDDVMQEVNLGIIIALSKWDKKISLEKPAGDSVELQLIDYFSKQRAIRGKERRPGNEAKE